MLFVFLIGSLAFYTILKSTSEKEVSAELNSRMEFLAREIEKNPENYRHLSIPGYITLERMATENKSPVFFRDTILFDPVDNSYEQYATLHADLESIDGLYHAVVYKSLIESNELIERIVLIVTIIFILFIFFLYLINRFMFGRVWSDFFRTLEKLKAYDVSSVQDLEFGESDIAEFKLLNTTLNQMIEKIRLDYENVKEFTGNISHEIQTPLSIIRMKCDLLLQSSPLNSEQANLIRDIQNTNSRLSKLNKTLVLLTKIENHQFTHKEPINFNEVIDRHLDNFKPIAELKNISITSHKSDDFSIEADPMLIDVLIVNLIKNAITHNIEGGKLNIEIRRKEIVFSNSGLNLDLSDQKIFERYKKVNQKAGTFGLGLSLAKNICELYNLKLVYHYLDKQHHFNLSTQSLS